MSSAVESIECRFGRLTVVARGENDRHGRVRWWCLCDCGEGCLVSGRDLRSGDTQSCGCLKRDILARRHAQNTTHGHARGGERHSAYGTWSGMKDRCRNPRSHAYANYGGRGIRVCNHWQGPDGFANFLADVGERPPGHHLHRVDNERGYEPGNVRWLSASEHSRLHHAERRGDRDDD